MSEKVVTSKSHQPDIKLHSVHSDLNPAQVLASWQNKINSATFFPTSIVSHI